MNTGYQKNIMWLLLLGAMAQVENTWAALGVGETMIGVSFSRKLGESVTDAMKRFKKTLPGDEEEKDRKSAQPVERVAFFVNRQYLKGKYRLLGAKKTGDDGLQGVHYFASGDVSRSDSGKQDFALEITADPSKNKKFRRARNIGSGTLFMGISTLFLGMLTWHLRSDNRYNKELFVATVGTCCASIMGYCTALVMNNSFTQGHWNSWYGPMFTSNAVVTKEKHGYRKTISTDRLSPEQFKGLITIVKGAEQDIDTAHKNPQLIQISCARPYEIYEHFKRKGFVCGSSCIG